MTTSTTQQRRSALPLLNLLVASAAVTIGAIAIATDDVGSTSQIEITPLDENHSAAAPVTTRPAGEVVTDRNDAPSYNPYVPPIGQTAPPVLTDRNDAPSYNPYVPPIGQTAPPVGDSE
jgi:hypothetical protein